MSAGQAENYVLLLVLLSIFAGGTLVLLSLLLLFCHRCCMGGRRYSRCEGRVISANGDSASFWCDNCEPDCGVLSPFRASDDLEKTNTTYAEDSQPTQGRSGVKVRLKHFFWRAGFASSVSLSQKSPFTWTNQTPSQPPAVTMESPSGSSPRVILAEESLSMNLPFMRRRRRLKATKCAGSDPLLSRADICDKQR